MLTKLVHEHRLDHQYSSSRFHFSEITKSRLHTYVDLARLVAADPDTQFRLIYVDKVHADISTAVGRREWKQKAKLSQVLLSKIIGRDEQVSVFFDRMPSPPHGTFEQVVLGRMRSRFGRQPVTTMLQLNSKACDGLQVADMFASAVMHELRQQTGAASTTNPKADLTREIRLAFNLPTLRGAQTPRFWVEKYELPKGTEVQRRLLR